MSFQVVDSSVITAALIDNGPEGEWSRRLLPEWACAAPSLLPYEVGNIIRRSTIRGVLDAAAGANALDRLTRMPFAFMPFDVIARRAWALRSNITTYDAAYVATAELIGCRFLTLDRKLAKAHGPTCEIITPEH
ncbi:MULTISPECIES: type II toxin-antitoxin system VapC family toxin [unclassified Gordonia (in: high G+C Gram-positive bacteria)]|uniref:type II toxin-antitoxin system VapC family toxin n=1 Tax=unclassified Gordonia (in: high G+C Gram-positive bacteria) TaxID=2657482 RepID=UPI001FFE9E21|nr:MULTISPECIES: type II toxin-antitoxin system VapC family toxin [unclassified Gordonia (in: high G+C Gram-positive bacteria)]UQE74336.1 type II toxin-antitoxin system VapC family toxin [Gordonia sp. PP30]